MMRLRHILTGFLTLALAIIIVGCSSTPSRRSVELPTTSSMTPLQKKVIAAAKKRLGVPYCYGGTGSCMDCSGLMVTIFQDIGIRLPRSSSQQYSLGKEIDPDEATVGDLVFFRNKAGTINHVGLYVGENNVIHASSSRGVIIQPLTDSYLANGFAGMRRYLPDHAIN